MIRIKDLSKVYKTGKNNFYPALAKVSFEIEHENMVAIIGESGSGKTTLMNLISTLDSPTGGFVEYDNETVTFGSDSQKADYRKNNTGFIFQSFNLIMDMNILDNVAIVMEIAGSEKVARYERANELLELVGLKEHTHKKPGMLSGGQKQRVAIARALANNPKLILADEPTGALDSTTTVEIMKLLKTIANSGTKILIVTHDMKVAAYCERIITMSDGQILSDELNEADALGTIELPKPIKKSSKGLGISGVFKLSSSAFKRKIKRNLLVSIGTAVALSSLLIINIVTNSLDSYVETMQDSYGNSSLVKVTTIDNTASADLVALSNKENIDPIEVNDSLKINEFDYVTSNQVLDTYTLNGAIEVTSENDSILTAEVMYPEGIYTFGTGDIKTGEAPVARNEIIISDVLATTLNLQVGDTTTLFFTDFNTNIQDAPAVEDPEALSMDATMTYSNPVTEEKFTVTGILDKNSLISSTSTVYFTNEFGKDYVDTFSPKIMLEQAFIIEDGHEDEFADYINDQAQINPFSGEQPDMFSYAVRDVEELAAMKEVLNGVFTIFNLILGVSVIVAAIMIAIMSYVSILERMREVGVLRAVGAKRRDVIAMFLLEAVAIGLLAAIIATLIGVAGGTTGVYFANYYGGSIIDITGIKFTMEISFISIVALFLGSIILAVISSIISILLGLRVTPVEALRKK